RSAVQSWGLTRRVRPHYCLVVVADDRAAATRAVCGATHAAPARPEDQREQCAGGTDREQDPADRVELDAADRGVDRPDQDGAGCDEQKTDSNTHCFRLLLRLCRENVESRCLDTGVEALQERRSYLCRLTPDRALGSVEETHAFLRDRGLLTRAADSALPSFFGACHEEPYAQGSRGFGSWPKTKYPWYFELARRPDVHELKVHRGKSILLTEEALRLV